MSRGRSLPHQTNEANMRESTDLRVVGAMIDIIESARSGWSNERGRAAVTNDTIDSLSTILIEGTSIRIDKRREIVGWVKERYWQEKAEQGTDDE